jgi:hypothetical protein
MLLVICAIVATDPTGGKGKKLLEQMRDVMQVKRRSTLKEPSSTS